MAQSKPTLTLELGEAAYVWGESVVRPKHIPEVALAAQPGLASLSQADAMQVLPELMPWVWPVPSSGTTSEAQWTFCDRMPTSVDAGIFLPSGASYSGNYRTFLAILDDTKFVPQDQLERARAANERPESGAVKAGFTQVLLTSGPAQLEPSFTVPFYPSTWTAASAGLPSMKLAVEGLPPEQIANLLGVPSISVSLGQQLELTAARWGVIPIAPGSWFDSGLLTLARAARGPYLGPYDNDIVFGSAGLLAGRVSAFLVAQDVEAVAPAGAGAGAVARARSVADGQPCIVAVFIERP
jgi:hypothetical protein